LRGDPATILAPLYPIENQMADKLRVLDAQYGSGPSTRYRDLYGRAMIVDQLPFDRSNPQRSAHRPPNVCGA